MADPAALVPAPLPADAPAPVVIPLAHARLGALLRALREAHGLSMRAAVERVGVSIFTISTREQGALGVCIDTCALRDHLCSLGMSPEGAHAVVARATQEAAEGVRYVKVTAARGGA